MLLLVAPEPFENDFSFLAPEPAGPESEDIFSMKRTSSVVGE